MKAVRHDAKNAAQSPKNADPCGQDNPDQPPEIRPLYVDDHFQPAIHRLEPPINAFEVPIDRLELSIDCLEPPLNPRQRCGSRLRQVF